MRLGQKKRERETESDRQWNRRRGVLIFFEFYIKGLIFLLKVA